jgi:ribosomal protein S15P/S13E
MPGRLSIGMRLTVEMIKKHSVRTFQQNRRVLYGKIYNVPAHIKKKKKIYEHKHSNFFMESKITRLVLYKT